MKSSITPENICNEVKVGRMSESMATNLLISVIEESDDSDLRAECIDTFEKLSLKSKKIYELFENLLISDENPLIRSVAAKAIINNFLKDGQKALNWAIIHDKSPLLLNTILNLFDNVEIEYIKGLNEEMVYRINTLASTIGIVPKEARFILDLEAIFAEGKNNYIIDAKIYEFCRNLTNVVNGKPWLVIRNMHIEALSFNYNNWKYIKESHVNIVSYFSKIKYLDLFLSSVSNLNSKERKILKIPKSIGLLTELKRLDLSRNNLIEIPPSIGSLSSLEKLNLSYNKMFEISDSICSLSSLKSLDLSYNNIRKIPESIKNLGSLVELNLEKNDIKIIPQSLKSFLDSLDNFSI